MAVNQDHIPKTLADVSKDAVYGSSKTGGTRITYIQDTLGLMALSLRIMSHNTLVIPIIGPTRVLEKTVTDCPINKKSVTKNPIGT